MAQTLELLTHRTATMQSIRGIVRTMKTMAAINARPYEQAAEAMAAYRAVVLDGFHAFARCHGPLPTEPDRGALPVVLAFGSDHGLCGNYNEIVAAEAAAAAGRAPGTRVLCVGAQMEDALAGQGLPPEATLLAPANADGLGRLAGRLITRLDALHRGGGAGSLVVWLVSMHRAPHGLQRPQVRRLLPLDPATFDPLATRAWASRSLPRCALPPDRLLAALIRNYLFAEIFRTAAEALVTENAARLARMQQAEQSIDDRLHDLLAETRGVRQSAITTELLDIVTGFEALRGLPRRRRRGHPDAAPGRP
jgi:F-type H+-transporting ATPase subunit gamma